VYQKIHLRKKTLLKKKTLVIEFEIKIIKTSKVFFWSRLIDVNDVKLKHELIEIKFVLFSSVLFGLENGKRKKKLDEFLGSLGHSLGHFMSI
jgi:hypothetical protein